MESRQQTEIVPTGRSNEAPVFSDTSNGNGHGEKEVRRVQEEVYHGQSATALAERAVVRKLDRNIIPLLFVLYAWSILDRTNIGNANVAGLSKNLHMTNGQYQWLLTIFYISYIVFEFATLFWKAVPAHILASFVIVSWGIIAACQAAAQNWSGLMALRFLLGGFEAAFGPALPYYLSFFYVRNELGFRIGMFLSAAPFASCFSSALAYGITSGHPTIQPWRVLFLAEGLPVIAMGVLTYFFLPDTPDKARFLNEEEKNICRLRGVRQVGDQVGKRIGSIDWREVVTSVTDLKNILPALLYFSTNIGFSSIALYLPQITKDLGFTAIHAQGLSAPPFFLAFLMVLGTTYISDRTRQRGAVIISVSLLGAIGYIVLAECKSVAGRYVALYIAAAGVYPAIINVLPWIINNNGSDTARGTGVVILNLIGQCSPLLGTRLYPASEAPFYRKGQWVCAAFLLFNAVLALIYRQILVRENKKLDAKYGAMKSGDMSATSSTVDLIGAENTGANYRYML